jgi:hypothetical protein
MRFMGSRNLPVSGEISGCLGYQDFYNPGVECITGIPGFPELQSSSYPVIPVICINHKYMSSNEYSSILGLFEPDVQN